MLLTVTQPAGNGFVTEATIYKLDASYSEKSKETLYFMLAS
jgi:hypothetical protein